MASSNRGSTTPTGTGSSSTGFPRLSIRALLLNGPFSRRSKTRRACTPTAVHSKGSSDSEGGSLDGGVDSCGRRRCGVLQGRLSSLAARQGKGGSKLSTLGQGSLLSNGESIPTTQSFNTSTGSSSHIKTMLLNTDIHTAQTPLSPSTSTTPQPHNTTSSSSTPPPFLQSQNSTSSADQLSRVSNFTPLPRGGGSKSSLSTTGDVSTTAANGDTNTCSAAASSSRGNSSNNLCDGGGGGENINGSSSSSGCSSSADCMTGASVGPLRECVLCLQDVPADRFPRLFSCSHSACLMCLKQYLAMEISESRVSITCPKCNELMHPTDIHQILNNSVLSYKFEDFMLRRVLSMDPDTRWCPAPDCGYAVIASGCAGCPKLQCERPGCHSYFCYHCKAEWHPNQTCDMARVQRAPHFPYSISSSHADDDVKACPRCQVLIVKMDDGSCNHMTCSVCGAEFCWLCMKEVSDLHYLSPSGCTFWGKKPWSRKKKVLWQLGTLVGAPLGIALLAGLAVPAIIIGIPMWAARKVHSRYSSAGRHKRNVMVVCSVVWSSLVSPVIAGVAVSIGVPILLAYVYGVVPISLCRSGGCGVITSATGVRIAFDDEMHDGGNPASSAFSAAMSGAAAMRNLTKFNDTCASSGGGGGSTDGGTGSERGRGDGGRGGCSEAGQEGSSHNPATGAGSLGSFSLISPRSHKLEVHVEMGTECSSSSHVGAGEGGRRFTCSSSGHRSGGSAATGETVSLAVSERSTTTLDTETASTRALAGSIAAGAAPAGEEFALKPWQEQQDEVASIVGVTNVAQAGDSASTVMLDNGDSISTAGGATGGGDSVSTTGGITGGDSLSTTSNGGGSGTGILRYPCGGGGGGAAPSILSSISATTTTNLFMPPQSSCSSVVSSPPPTSSSAGYYSPSLKHHSANGGSVCNFHHHQRRVAGGNGGRNFSNRTQFVDEEDDDTSNNNMNNDTGSYKSCGTDDVTGEGGYISGGDCSLGGGIVGPGCGGGAVGPGGRQFGSDPRLDSVSAIITARKMSAHAKGVTFSMSSASSSQSRDHISLNLDENMAGDNMDAEIYSSASGVSGLSASVSDSTSASVVGDEDSYCQVVVNGINNVTNVNGIRHHLSRSSSSSGSAKSEEVLLSQQQGCIDNKNSVLDSNSEAGGIDVSVRHWFNVNGNSQTFNNFNNGGKTSMGRKVNIVPYLDYRETCGDCHYHSNNEVKPGNIKSSSKYYPSCERAATNSAMYSLKSTSCDPMPEDLQRHWVYFSEGSKLDQTGEGHQSERACVGNSTSDGVKSWQTPLERHMSVPEGCSVATEGSAYLSSSPTTCSNTATTRSESLSALECSLRR